MSCNALKRRSFFSTGGMIPRRVVLSLFDHSTLAIQPWADAGYECHAFDLHNTNTFVIIIICPSYYLIATKAHAARSHHIAAAAAASSAASAPSQLAALFFSLISVLRPLASRRPPPPPPHAEPEPEARHLSFSCFYFEEVCLEGTHAYVPTPHKG